MMPAGKMVPSNHSSEHLSSFQVSEWDTNRPSLQDIDLRDCTSLRPALKKKSTGMDGQSDGREMVNINTLQQSELVHNYETKVFPG